MTKLVLLCNSAIWIFLIFCQIATAVDRTNFKTCEQSSFCRRCRKSEPDKSAYELDLDTLDTLPGSVSVDIINTENSVRFRLTVSGLKKDIIRLQVVEKEPQRERFNASSIVLLKEPTLSKLGVTKTDKVVTLNFNKYRIELQSLPFRIDVFSGSDLIISGNARGLFQFEHTRTKTEGDSENDPGTWEENWKTHHDKKPYGPTAVAMDFTFHGAQAAYGLPEHADSLRLKTTTKGDPYRFYNLDVFEYELDNPMALYASIPLLFAHSEAGTQGLFWLNPSETWVDIVAGPRDVVSSIVNLVSGGASTPQVDSHFMSESGNIDVFLLLGPSPAAVSDQYSTLTGTGALPPFFSLGYHQSRWNYVDQEDVNSVHKSFDQHDIPVDLIWLDIEYTDGKKYFTWDPHKFSNPLEMQHNLTAKGRKLVVIIDPHIKRDPGYFLHNDLTSNGYNVKNKDNDDYEGWCWPGSSSYIDFLNPAAMEYYSSRYSLTNFPSTTTNVHLWNDMNEPSVFNGPEVTMPKDNIHFGGWEHREVHNLYGLLNVMGTYNGLLHRTEVANVQDIQRPFILTRSAFAGSQRYAAIWTGDNMAEWSHLAASLPMCLSLALGGMSFCGADVGGFFKNPEKELFIRWYQTGSWLPFFRAHSHIDTRRREPWLFDDETIALTRAAIRSRYSYLPYWYTLFQEYNTTGIPVIRPLWYEFPKEVDTYQVEDHFLVGSNVLVRPVTESGVTKQTVTLPGSPGTLWYEEGSWEALGPGKHTVPAPLSRTPVFHRGGSIIPKKERVRRATQLMHKDPYTLIVALDSNEKAEGQLYIDDGRTHRYNYRTDSSVLLKISFDGGKLSSKFVGKNRYKTDCRIERILILGLTPGNYRVISTSSLGENSLESWFDKNQKIFTIRKPDIPIAEEWTIMLNK